MTLVRVGPGIREATAFVLASSLTACSDAGEHGSLDHASFENAASDQRVEPPPPDAVENADIRSWNGGLIDKNTCTNPRWDQGETIELGGGEFQEVVSCPAVCPLGSYAYSIKVKSLAKQGSGDDQSITGILLGCNDPETAEWAGSVGWVATGSGGTWGDWATCEFVDYPIFAGHLRYDGKTSGSDDKATTEIEVGCGEDTNTVLYFHELMRPEIQPGTDWGRFPTRWWPEPRCPAYQHVCGVSISAGDDGSNDEVGVDAVEFECCW